jgi:hypothetical protein
VQVMQVEMAISHLQRWRNLTFSFILFFSTHVSISRRSYILDFNRLSTSSLLWNIDCSVLLLHSSCEDLWKCWCLVGEIPNTARNRPLNILVTQMPGIWHDVLTLVIMIEERNEVEMNTSSGRPGDLRALCIVAAYPPKCTQLLTCLISFTMCSIQRLLPNLTSCCKTSTILEDDFGWTDRWFTRLQTECDGLRLKRAQEALGFSWPPVAVILVILHLSSLLLLPWMPTSPR